MAQTETLAQPPAAVAAVKAPFEPLSQRIRSHALRDPQGIALRIDSTEFTWAAFDHLLDRVAARLVARGIVRGDRIAAIGPNSPEYLLLFVGAVRAGACMVPLPTMTSLPSIVGMVNDAQARMVFAASAQHATMDEARTACASLREFVSFDIASPGWEGWASWLGEDTLAAPADVPVTEDDLFNIMYSSGTTGEPKGIVHSHGMRNEHLTRMGRFGIGPGTVTLISTPLYSNTTHACLLGSIGLGGKTVMMRKFDALGWLKLAQDERVTHTMLVPVQVQRILAHPDFERFDLSAFQWKLCTSAPLSPLIKRDAIDRWPGKMLEIYGHSEGGANCNLVLNDFPDKLHTVGRPIAGCVVKMIDEAGHELPRGQTGELVGRQPAMMVGYFMQPEKTEEVTWYDSDGERYYRSGDVGHFDEDGFVVLLDRTKDMIVSGGFNVYAVDIERVIEQHPDVAEVAVVGIPSEQWGETPLAFVVPRAGTHTLDAAALRTWANERLGKLQRISGVELRDALPRSEVGKILKRELRAPYAAPAADATPPAHQPAHSRSTV
ncbi:class I adenylate-forming enzyme family protein [Hydrogenophaga sp.]|uniref:class I adenylate-forming enzyme family protein n=1 Tax=Hydrogenophaga sp. TaxID=1904254 RepID=UPI0027230A1B|nr:class I adenylate-forming enzyme family protein [Hydrogenophaga sp.]MDO9435475.1 class I adenylate-forming enzyme family protein [Hydrogenophaga sp.]